MVRRLRFRLVCPSLTLPCKTNCLLFRGCFFLDVDVVLLNQLAELGREGGQGVLLHLGSFAGLQVDKGTLAVDRFPFGGHLSWVRIAALVAIAFAFSAGLIRLSAWGRLPWLAGLPWLLSGFARLLTGLPLRHLILTRLRGLLAHLRGGLIQRLQCLL